MRDRADGLLAQASQPPRVVLHVAPPRVVLHVTPPHALLRCPFCIAA